MLPIAASALLLEFRFMGGLARFLGGEEAIPRFGEIDKGLRVGIAMDALEPWPTVLVEPLGVAILDRVELLFKRHRVGFRPAAYCRFHSRCAMEVAPVNDAHGCFFIARMAVAQSHS